MTTKAAFAAAVILMTAAFVSAHPNHAPDAGAAPIEDARREVLNWTTRAAANPGDASVHTRLGQAHLALARRTTDHADFARAEAAFRRVLEIEPANFWAPYGLAYALVGQHRFKEALDSARVVATHEPTEPEVLALLADIHLSLGNNAEALAISRHLAEANITPETLARVALAQHASGDLDGAIATMEDALEAGRLLESTDALMAWVRSMLGDFALDAGDLARARAECEAALLLDPACHHAQWRLAQLDLRDAHADSARDRLVALVDKVPKPVYFETLAKACAATDSPDAMAKATAALDRAEKAMLAEIDAKGLGHFRELAEFWIEHPAGSELAARTVELALRDVTEVRQDPGAFDTAAWALYKAGRTSEALPFARQAVLRNPGSRAFAARAGIVLLANQDIIEGRRLLASALQRPDALTPALAEEARKALEGSDAKAPAATLPSSR
ncbi:MAG: tetratricopeptide repeat protein [Planctomycetes bacterium]|nr:tetratricopeptide repeat protein [Planctomycetota bacterium]